jgi:hypothetical protein
VVKPQLQHTSRDAGLHTELQDTSRDAGPQHRVGRAVSGTTTPAHLVEREGLVRHGQAQQLGLEGLLIKVNTW